MTNTKVKMIRSCMFIVLLLFTCYGCNSISKSPGNETGATTTSITNTISEPSLYDSFMESALEKVKEKWIENFELGYYPDWNDKNISFSGFHLIDEKNDIGKTIVFEITDGNRFGEATVTRENLSNDIVGEITLQNISLGNASRPFVLGETLGDTNEYSLKMSKDKCDYFSYYTRKNNIIRWIRDSDCI